MISTPPLKKSLLHFYFVAARKQQNKITSPIIIFRAIFHNLTLALLKRNILPHTVLTNKKISIELTGVRQKKMATPEGKLKTELTHHSNENSKEQPL